MTVSKNMLTMFKVLYWVVLTLAHLFLCYILLSTNRVIAGILWLVSGFILIFIMYYIYFPAGNPSATWPPYISSCPDYLTMIAPHKCVDFVGLNSPLLKRSDPKLRPSPTDTTRVFDSSGTTPDRASRALQYGLTWSGIT
jgi:hypothetical protein